MMKRFCLLLCLLLLLFTPVVHAIDGLPQENPSLPIEISEIYPNATGSSESASESDIFDPENPLEYEYIELHNLLSIPYELDNFYLSRQGNNDITLLDDIIIPADGYLIIFPDFTLPNSFSSTSPVTISLNYIVSENEELSLLYTYHSGLGEDKSSSLNKFGEWEPLPPTPGEINFTLQADNTADDDDAEQILCQIDSIFINEIVANPAGADSAGGEFVELYNGGDQAINLEGCIIKTDKLGELILPSVVLETGDYYVVELSNDLLNSGGTVTLVTADEEQAVTYPGAGDDKSWSVINGAWEETTVMTPGAENQPTPEELEETETDEGLGPCPEGEFRNPETNRCKNIVDTASSLLPCSPGSTRNPETNRCRKITSITSTLKPCDADQERNPATNRCRKITSATSELKPCDEGEERNPDTNRCRKAGAVLSGATIDPPGQEAGIHTSVFLVMTLLAAAYGIYEYRLDFVNWYHKIKIPKLLQKQR